MKTFIIQYGKKKGTLSFNAGCADDLPSNIFWKTMGWTQLNQRNGISHKNTWKQTSKRKVNLYRYDPYDMFLILSENKELIKTPKLNLCSN